MSRFFKKLSEFFKGFQYIRNVTKRDNKMDEHKEYPNEHPDIDLGAKQYEYQHADEIANAPVRVEVVSHTEPKIYDSNTGREVTPDRSSGNSRKQQVGQDNGTFDDGYQQGYAAGFKDGQESVPRQKVVRTEVCERNEPVSQKPLPKDIKVFRIEFKGGRKLSCIAESIGQAIARIGKDSDISEVVSINEDTDIINAL